MDSMEQRISFKNKLKHFCEGVMRERIAATRAAMDSAQSAANGEEKSSAGDKYETSRAMNHLEKDMHARQLMNHLRQFALLQAVDVNRIYTSVAAGAFIQCRSVSFFIVAGLGKQLVDEVQIIFLSAESPLARQMMGKTIGDVIVFNGEFSIADVY
jgi:transcription elongation GreA/GreB family factor